MRLVLLPGLDGTGDLFAPFAGAVGGGMGGGVTAQPVRYPVHESDPAALLAVARAALPTTGDFVLLGESFSGPHAIALAAERPASLRGLILVCTYVRPPRPWLGPWIARLPLPPMAAPMLGLGAPAALRRDLARAVRQVPAAVLRARLRSIERVDAREALRAVTAPILVLSATRDRT